MEQAALEFVQNTLRPWLVRFEATISRDLLLPSERGRYYARHNLNALLRGDLAARAQFYGQMLDRGVYDLDEVRQLEELNALPGGLGTLEETLEVLTWSQLGIHAKPVALVDVAGYYAGLRALLAHAEREGFLRPENAVLVIFAGAAGEALDRLARWTPPRVARPWLRTSET